MPAAPPAMQALRRRELLLSLKNATIEASFSVPMLNLTLTAHPFVLGFAVAALGWGPEAIGWLAAVHHLCNAAQPPVTAWLERRMSLHRIMVWGFVLNALPWALAWTLPWLGAARDAAFILVVVVATLANAVCAVAWSAAMTDLVPLSIRGTYFGRRNAVFGFWTLVVVLTAGYVAERWDNALTAFGIIFAVAAGLRLIGLVFLLRMKFPARVMECRPAAADLATYLAPLRDRDYRWLMLFVGAWGFCLALGQPFYSLYVLRELGFTMRDLTVLSTLASLGGLVSLRSWGPLTDRFGNKPAFLTCAFLWAFTAMLAWLFAGPQRSAHLYVNYFLTGYLFAGFQLCQFNLMLKLVPTERKSHYISVFYAVTSLMTALGPLVGGWALARLPHEFGSLLGQPLLGYHALFAGSLLLCLCTLHLLGPMHEPAQRPVRELVRAMRAMREFNPVLGLSSMAQHVFTPRAIVQLAGTSWRTLRRQTRDVTEVGGDLLEEGWKSVRDPFRKGP